MTDELLQSLFRQMPVGCASHRLIRSEAGELTDLIFMEANSAFQEMTGLDTRALSGKRVKEQFAVPRQNGFDWAAFYNEIILGNWDTPRYAEILKRRYKVTALFPDAGHLALVFENVPNEIQSSGKPGTISSDLEIIFDSTYDPMFLVEYDGEHFTYIRNNRVHQELTGYSLEKFAGKTPVELLGEKNGEYVEEKYRRCVESGTNVIYDDPLELRGAKRDWLTNMTPVRKDGKVRYLVGSRTDVTEIRGLQREKADLLNSLQDMFSRHTASMLLVEPDSGRIVDVNPSACAFYGYSKKELLAMTVQDINMLPEDEIRRLRMVAFSQGQKYFLFPHRLKNGEIRMVDVYSSPVDYGGTPVLFSIIFDATDREKYRNAMNQERELLSVTLHSIGDGVLTTDIGGAVTSLNTSAEFITGWREQEVVGRHFSDIMRLRNEETGKEVENPIELVMKSGRVIGLANHTVLIRRDGRPVPIDDSAAPIRNETGRSFGVVMVFRDVSHEKEQQKKIIYLSYRDTLTGLHNRRYLEEQITALDTQEHLPLAVVMGDVNGLKMTNDVFGHQAGDMLLKQVAEILKENCRGGDVLARWGGDEFLLLMPGASLQEAEKYIELVRRDFAKSRGESLQLSVSLGCAVKERAEENLQEALRQAEESMYHQKLMEGSSYRNTIINTLLATLSEKSMETEEHAERLKVYCGAIGRAMQLNAEEFNELMLLAVLHDIGKVGVNQCILQKPGPLTPEEWKAMKKHSVIGYRIAQNTPELSAVSECILSHHERWDGKGYPRKLKGEEIPALSRILAVADAYDAMTNDRVYRKALSGEEAILELKRNAGTQFDPSVVSLFIKLFAGGNAPDFRELAEGH